MFNVIKLQMQPKNKCINKEAVKNKLLGVPSFILGTTVEQRPMYLNMFRVFCFCDTFLAFMCYKRCWQGKAWDDR